MSLISISDVDEEGTSLALLGGVRLRSSGSTDCTDELCRVDSHFLAAADLLRPAASSTKP